MSDRLEQPDLWAPVVRRRGVMASTTLASDLPADLKATQRSKIVNLLAADGRLTYHEIAARTGIELQTVCWRMKELKANGHARFAKSADGALLKQGNRKLVELVSPLKRAG